MTDRHYTGDSCAPGDAGHRAAGDRMLALLRELPDDETGESPAEAERAWEELRDQGLDELELRARAGDR